MKKSINKNNFHKANSVALRPIRRTLLTTAPKLRRLYTVRTAIIVSPLGLKGHRQDPKQATETIS